MTQYTFDISSEEQGTAVAVGYGSLSLVSYAAKEAADIVDQSETYSVNLSEFVGDDGDELKTVISLTADGGTVLDLVSTRLRRLRKAAKDAAAPAAVVSVS
jgi:hypothetical protein